MLSIFNILHHCNVLQRLGGSFPHHTLVRCPYLPAADNLVHHGQPAQVPQGPGMLCQAAGLEHSSSSSSVLIIPSTVRRWQGTALVADHFPKKFPVLQRRPDLPFSLHSIPGIASRTPGAGDNTSTAKHCLGSSPQLCPTAWAIPRAVLCWGGHWTNRVYPKSLLRLNQDRISLARHLFCCCWNLWRKDNWSLLLHSNWRGETRKM